MYPSELFNGVPKSAGLYAFFQKYKAARTPCAYVGSSAAQGKGAGNLQSRLKQHLSLQIGTVGSKGRAVSVNIDQLTDCSYWVHEKFPDKKYLHAAELIFMDSLKPVYRNENNIMKEAYHIIDEKHELYDPEFVSEMEKLAKNPSGNIPLPSLKGMNQKITELEMRVSEIERIISNQRTGDE